ncbi:SDR family oxidoreductase [Actinomycetospora sp. CA-084318]|uniref:SDR family oxidoreductase n=1 Tax=Actinomycetospora sp. CA-084318 TaxID=3239892 RepID=UPI003D9908E5
MTDLTGSVVVVAGATRGAGRGIAAAFGEAGATVVCTGRSSRAGRADVVSDYAGRPETIEGTAELVTTLGGRGIARQVDHLDSTQVAGLAAWCREEFGGIDVLVNDIWGAEDLKGAPPEWNTPLWEHDLEVGLRILRLAIDTHLITSHHLLPLVLARPGGLVVEVTDGTTAFNAGNYRISTFYDLAKVAVNRLGWSQGHELAPHGATALAVTPGWMRSELMLETFGVTEETWREAVGSTAPDGFAHSETPRFVGRGIAALAADPDRARWNQASVTAGELARAYSVVDLDGTQPDAWATP